MENPILLQKGDIIRLEEGMKVYASLPEKFVFVNTPFSDKSYESVITLGHTLKRKIPNRDKFIKELKGDIENRLHREITNEQVSNFIDSLGLNFSAEEFDTSIYLGVYRVYQALSNGGNSDYPNGWHVYCEKVDNPEVTVHFYQEGCFTAVIPNIKPINQN